MENKCHVIVSWKLRDLHERRKVNDCFVRLKIISEALHAFGGDSTIDVVVHN